MFGDIHDKLQRGNGEGIERMYGLAGCIATFLDDFLELGQDAADLLNCDEKASLLAVARCKVTASPLRPVRLIV